MRESVAETIVGAGVLAVAAAFLVSALSQTGRADVGGGYRLNAAFSSASGLNAGSDVRMAGVKIGTVAAITLDQARPELSAAAVELAVRPGVQVPTGTVAKVQTDGLLGGAFVSLEPACDAFAEEGTCPLLAPGASIEFTRGSVDILTLFAQMMGGSSEGSTSSAPPAETSGGYPE
jgi:phospholipid/cholesterol/gamma-HCH transport system substrate-binding protein